ncbi:hypothetical protein [Pseudonocardia ailaonensis]
MARRAEPTVLALVIAAAPWVMWWIGWPVLVVFGVLIPVAILWIWVPPILRARRQLARIQRREPRTAGPVRRAVAKVTDPALAAALEAEDEYEAGLADYLPLGEVERPEGEAAA